MGRGVPLRVIAETLGLESRESTKIHTQLSFAPTRQIAERSGHRTPLIPSETRPSAAASAANGSA
jgi:hypothetical protein